MDDPTPAAPELELTTPPADAAEDALQVAPTDLPPPGDADAPDPFAMHLPAAKPADAAPAETAKPTKPAKPVTAAANDSVVAALMGRSIAKSGKSAKSKAAHAPAGAPAVTPAVSATPGVDPADAPLVMLDDAVASTPAAAATAVVAVAEVLPTLAAPIEVPPALAQPMAAVPAASPGSISSTPVSPTPARPAAAVVLSGVIHATPAPEPIRVATPLIMPPATPVIGPTLPSAVAPVAAVRPARRAIPVAPAWPKVAPIPTPPAAAVARPVAVSPAVRPRVPVSPKIEASSPADFRGTGFEPVAGSPETRVENPCHNVVVPAGPAGPTGAWWTIPLTFVGIAIVACAVLIPAADQNRRDAYELAKMDRDVAHLREQAAVNADFLRRVDTDATLAERLALRTLHQTRAGVRVAPLAGRPDRFGSSPFAMTRLDPPAPLAPYTPMPGRLSTWFLGDKRPQQMAALGLLVAGAGVLIGGRRRPLTPSPGMAGRGLG